MAKLQNYLLTLLVFIFPLFFMATTQEFFLTNKFYLLGFGVLVFILALGLQTLISRSFTWRKTVLDVPLVIFLVLYGSSVVISSPNKIQALLNPTTGFGVILFLTLLYFVITQSESKPKLFNVLNWSALIVAVISIVWFFNPFANVTLPSGLAFLKNPSFTTLGGPIELLLFLGFFTVRGVITNFSKNWEDPKSMGGPTSKKNSVISIISLVLILIAFALTAYNVFKPASISANLPPYNVTWYSAIETLKNPKTAFFGVGPDNFASVYTRVKTPQYNATNLWNTNFTQGRSFILQLWTETGLLGLAALILVLLAALRSFKGSARYQLYYLVAVLLLFPPTLITLFLLYLLFTTAEEKGAAKQLSPQLAVVIAVLLLAVVGSLGYFLNRGYLAEYTFKKGLNGFAKNNAKQVYDNMRQAIQINPYMERFRTNFSQVNFLIANNIAARARPAAGEDPNTAKPLSAQDRQTVTQAIQASISEAKAAVALNPNKASSWENLAGIYKNLLNAAQGADAWTVASYQRAIVIDPQNPIYRLNLGGVYYSLQNYDEAMRLFDQAARLKPDWPNAHYNLAWANYQKKDFRRAAVSMENVVKLLEKNKTGADYKKASAELEQFKKQIPAAEATGSGSLNLPQQPSTTIDPKLELPKTASPEAR